MNGHGRKQTMNKSRVCKIHSEESWDYFINQKSLIMVHFTAAWCMPSVAMNKFFEELAFSCKDVIFLLVDVDEVKEVASKMGIRAMPTFVIMKEGVQIEKLIGANPQEIKTRIHALLNPNNN